MRNIRLILCLNLGSGLAAGAIGGAILGHVLTPTQTKVIEQAPAAAAAAPGGSAGGSTIVIVDGQVVNTTDANGVVVINTGSTPAPATAAAGETPAPAAAGETPAPLAPMASVPAADAAQNSTTPAETPMAPMPADNSTAPAANPEQPAPGGIICVPFKLNETDPNDATKMIEVEKIACYPAPPPPPPAEQQAANATAPLAAPVEAAAGSAPLAPLQPIAAESSSQQLQQESTKIGDESLKEAGNNSNRQEFAPMAAIICFVLSYLVAYN